MPSKNAVNLFAKAINPLFFQINPNYPKNKEIGLKKIWLEGRIETLKKYLEQTREKEYLKLDYVLHQIRWSGIAYVMKIKGFTVKTHLRENRYYPQLDFYDLIHSMSIYTSANDFKELKEVILDHIKDQSNKYEIEDSTFSNDYYEVGKRLNEIQNFTIDSGTFAGDYLKKYKIRRNSKAYKTFSNLIAKIKAHAISEIKKDDLKELKSEWYVKAFLSNVENKKQFKKQIDLLFTDYTNILKTFFKPIQYEPILNTLSNIINILTNQIKENDKKLKIINDKIIHINELQLKFKITQNEIDSERKKLKLWLDKREKSFKQNK